ncbi:MAG: ComF family protein [Chloroflexota bacterium]|nr:phosphoribosyltransferase family protein [Lentimicrobium sp.]
MSSLTSLFYPRTCFACGKGLFAHEEVLCTDCIHGLPETDFHLMPENPVINQFYGKINFSAAASFYYFTKGGKVQQLVHNLKYKGHRQIGEYAGNLYGSRLAESPLFSDIHDILPIPLHPSRLKQRGYNQAEYFARGLAKPLSAKVHTDVLVRVHASETQTHKSRFNRWENVKDIFQLQSTTGLEGKHLLLVDDVITTGSTLEAAGHVLFQIPDVKISVCSLACSLH